MYSPTPSKAKIRGDRELFGHATSEARFDPSWGRLVTTPKEKALLSKHANRRGKFYTCSINSQ